MDRQAAEGVARAFGLGAVAGDPAFVARGAMGRIWRVDTAAGRWAVKELFDAPTGGDAGAADVAFQAAAAGAGLRLPAPRSAVDGRFVADGVRVYEWVDLGPPIGPSAPLGVVREAGALLGRLHGLRLPPPDGAVVDDWYASVPEETALPLREVVASATWDEDVIICHRDFHPANVLPSAGDGGLVVLDWENAGPLPAEQELGISLDGWVGGRDDLGDAVGAFLDGYASAGGFARIRDRSSFATLVAVEVRFLGVLGDLAAGDDPDHRAYAEAALPGQRRGVERLLPRIETLVDSARS